MGMKRRRLPELNPETVKRAKEMSVYAWAIWCPHELDFHRQNAAPRLFNDEATAALYANEGSCEKDKIVQVKVVTE